MDARGRLPMRGWTVLLTVVVAGLALVACGDDEEPAGAPATQAPTTTAATTVAVTLQEFSVLPAPASAPAGQVTFQAKNTGPKDPHELVVIRTDESWRAADHLRGGSTRKARGRSAGRSRSSRSGTRSEGLRVTAGSYVLICTVVEDEGRRPRLTQAGMRPAFTVQYPPDSTPGAPAVVRPAACSAFVRPDDRTGAEATKGPRHRSELWLTSSSERHEPDVRLRLPLPGPPRGGASPHRALLASAMLGTGLLLPPGPAVAQPSKPAKRGEIHGTPQLKWQPANVTIAPGGTVTSRSSAPRRTRSGRGRRHPTMTAGSTPRAARPTS